MMRFELWEPKDNHNRSFRALRQRPLLRYLLFLALFLFCVYVLSHFGPQYYPGYSIGSKEAPSWVWRDRREKVKQAFEHAYHGYERFAAPSDELLPLTNYAVNHYNRWGLTVFDSLDTMILMGLDDDFERALIHVQKTEFTLPTGIYAPYFETIIRYLGGLLSAYALSNNTMLLKRADELAIALDPVYRGMNGFPSFGVNPSTGQTKGDTTGVLAEIGSLQLEYTYLAKITGKQLYFDRANDIMKKFAGANLAKTGGMLPIMWNLETEQPENDALSVGAQADSAHEYLLKQYLLTSKKDKKSLELYIQATTVIISKLLYLSPTRKLLYVTDLKSTRLFPGPTHIFEHLSCFLPGLLVLGAHTLPLDNLESLGISLSKLGQKAEYGEKGEGYRRLSKYNLTQVHLWAAEGIAQTCWLTYADQPTGLGPDEVVMNKAGLPWIDALDRWKSSGARGPPPGVADQPPVVYSYEDEFNPTLTTSKRRDYSFRKGGYLLRPETLESFYLLWRYTKDKKWRERSWTVFEAIEKHTKTQVGYANLKDVQLLPSLKEDIMPSYFLAETLKYLYFIFSDEDLIPLDKWVLNTEAHPLPIFDWTKEERERFKIDY